MQVYGRPKVNAKLLNTIYPTLTRHSLYRYKLILHLK